MREIILDERAWAESALNNLSLGSRPIETLGRIAKYYFSEGYTKREIPKMLEGFLVQCDPTASVAKWQPVIDSIAKGADKYPLIDVNGVSITRGEMDKIATLKTKMLKKLMFTLLCIAKYGNAVNKKNNNWVNCAPRDIFIMANIKTTSLRQSLLINDLWQAGYIGYSNVIDNVNLNVKIISEDDGIDELFITDFRNLGNQYLRFIGEQYIECSCCGAIVKATSNRRLYCDACAVEMNREKTSENYRKSAAS